MGKKHYNPELNKILPCRAKTVCKFSQHFEGMSLEEGKNYINSINDYKVKKNISFKENIETYYNSLLEKSKIDTKEADVFRNEVVELKKLLRNGKTTEKIDWNTLLNDISEPDGGASFNPFTEESPQVGFCYSPYPEHSKVISVKEATKEKILEYAKENEELLKKKGHIVGLWNDPASGKIYLDISVNNEDAVKARKECEEEDQIAFFDLQTFNSVTVNPNATSGQ